jgi:hypothetical protein
MCPIFTENLDDVTIRKGIHKLENVCACRQDLGANARNFDWPTEGNYSFVIPIVRRCFWRGDHTEYGDAQSSS